MKAHMYHTPIHAYRVLGELSLDVLNVDLVERLGGIPLDNVRDVGGGVRGGGKRRRRAKTRTLTHRLAGTEHVFTT